MQQKHPILYKILYKTAKITFRFFRPVFRFLKRKYKQYQALLPDMHYHTWATENERVCFVDKALSHKPIISIVVPLYNTRTDHLLHMIYSVVNQHYENWELVLVNASTDPVSRHKAHECQYIDTRIKIVALKSNKGIAGNTNAGIAEATGDYIAFLDHDDMLHPCALHSIVESLQGTAKPGFIYTDEDKITDGGDRYFDPLCKPRWSPDLMRNVNYVNHLTVIRADYIKQVGGLRKECDGAQDYDLMLRVIDVCKPKIHHVPRVLYHWRAAASSTASDISTKSYIFKAGERAIADHLARNDIHATVAAIPGRPGWYELHYKKVGYAIAVGPVAPEKRHICAQWVQDLIKRADKDTELIIGSWYEKYAKQFHPKFSVRYIEDSPEYWQMVAEKTSKPVLICFKMAGLPVNDGALSELAAAAADSNHTAVSPVVIGADKTILDYGIVDTDGFPRQLFFGNKMGENTYFGNTDWVRNVSDLSTNIIAIKSKDFRALIAQKPRYSRASTLCSLGGNDFTMDNLVVWAHTPFKYKGMLTQSRGDSYHNVQLFRFTPKITMHVDNWEKGYERAAE